MEASEVGPKPNKTKRWKYISALSVAIIMLTGASSSFILQDRHKNALSAVIPTEARHAATFPIYIPQPNIAAVDKSSVQADSDAVTYSTRLNNSNVVVTEQPLPADFALSNYVSRGVGVSDVQTFDSPNGHGMTGTINARAIMILATDKTLITATSASATFHELQSLARSLARI